MNKNIFNLELNFLKTIFEIKTLKYFPPLIWHHLQNGYHRWANKNSTPDLHGALTFHKPPSECQLGNRERHSNNHYRKISLTANAQLKHQKKKYRQKMLFTPPTHQNAMIRFEGMKEKKRSNFRWLFNV